MPLIVCSYCEYCGEGDTLEDMYKDIEEHEKDCKVKVD